MTAKKPTLKQQVVSLKEQMSERGSAIASLVKKNNQLLNTVTKLRKERAALNNKIDGLMQAVSKHSEDPGDITQWRDIADSRLREIQGLEAAATALHKDIDRMAVEASDLRRQLKYAKGLFKLGCTVT